MEASYNWPSSMMAITNKSKRHGDKNIMVSIKNTKLMAEVFKEHHVVDDGDTFVASSAGETLK